MFILELVIETEIINIGWPGIALDLFDIELQKICKNSEMMFVLVCVSCAL